MVTPTETGQAGDNSGLGLSNGPEKPIPTTPGRSELSNPPSVTISGELYAFLMGEGPLEGVWFGDMNKGFRGAFWWRALLRCAAGWPDAAAQADRSPEGGDHEDGRHAKHESAVAAGHAPKPGQKGSSCPL